MPTPEKRYFELSLDELRAIGGWAAECAERALPLYERAEDADRRPRLAIEGIREFADGGARTARLRTLALDANAAARDIADPAAAAAARSAGAAAASAYTHPLVDVHQTKHVVGAAAYAALAVELASRGDATAADCEIGWAVDRAPNEARHVLVKMPARELGRSRLDALLFAADAGLRSRNAR